MTNQTNAVSLATPLPKATQVYTFALVFLLIGLAIGYFSRAARFSAPAVQPVTRPAPPSAAANAAHAGRMPTLDELRQMADKQAAPLDPKNSALRTKFAISLYRDGDSDGAIVQLNQALQIGPKDANALFNLGMIRLQGKHDPKGALAAWQKLLKSNPDLTPDRKAEVQKLIAQVLTMLGDQHGMQEAPVHDGH